MSAPTISRTQTRTVTVQTYILPADYPKHPTEHKQGAEIRIRAMWLADLLPAGTVLEVVPTPEGLLLRRRTSALATPTLTAG